MQHLIPITVKIFSAWLTHSPNLRSFVIMVINCHNQNSLYYFAGFIPDVVLLKMC